MMSAGAVLVVVLGISMFNSGLSLSGLLIPTGNGTAPVVNQAETEGDIQLVRTSLKSGRYQPITVQVGMPVKWTIHVEPGTYSYSCWMGMIRSTITVVE